MRRVHRDYGASINSQNGSSFSRRAPASVLVRSRKKDPNRSSKPLGHSRKLALEPEPADDAVDVARTAEPAPWKDINARITTALATTPTGGTVQEQTDRLMDVVLEAVHTLAPEAEPSPYAKR